MGRRSNHLFRADTAGGERLVVRVCLPGGCTDAELDAELAWLAALAPGHRPNRPGGPLPSCA